MTRVDLGWLDRVTLRPGLGPWCTGFLDVFICLGCACCLLATFGGVAGLRGSISVFLSGTSSAGADEVWYTLAFLLTPCFP